MELYLKEAKVPDEKKGQELVSLLEDEAFRIVSQMGFLCDDAIDYTAVKKCLEKQFAPPGVELEWQRKLHMAQQKSAESLTEFAARLRMLADRAFPSWQPEDRLEMARNQFINGVLSSTIQLKLLQEQPQTLDDVITLATQLEGVELAQRSLQATKLTAGVSDEVSYRNTAGEFGKASGDGYEELVAPVRSLSQQLGKLRADKEETRANKRGAC